VLNYKKCKEIHYPETLFTVIISASVTHVCVSCFFCPFFSYSICFVSRDERRNVLNITYIVVINKYILSYKTHIYIVFTDMALLNTTP